MPRASRAASVPAPPVLAVLRFPRTLPQLPGRAGATTPTGELVMVFDATQRGKQVDVTDPTGAPLGRVAFAGRGRWVLTAPHTGATLAEADARNGVRASIGGGPWAVVKGRGEEWDLLWETTPLLAARQVPRKVARGCVDVWVHDPACTPVVVAFVLHVRRLQVAAAAADQLIIQQMLTAPPPTTS